MNDDATPTQGSTAGVVARLEYATPQPPASVACSIGWAVFLACSWTWCIGMFLPVLLVRDFGVWGWVVFAIPNVLGAAAMGWVLRTREISHEIVHNHRLACLSFSTITVLFHVLFVGWVINRLIGPSAWLALILAFPVMMMGGTARREAAAAFSISIAALVLFVVQTEESLPRFDDLHLVPLQLAYLAPVCIFGFALCPYLDLTFHRARQGAATLEASRIAFGIGFGVCFLLMILFTLLYGDIMGDFFFPYRSDVRGNASRLASWIIAIHMIVQTAFTVGIHMREVATARQFARFIVVGAVLFGVGSLWSDRIIALRGRMELGELAYRIFMGFYGLVFPAYIWICMLGSPRTAPDRRHWIVFATAVVLAMPFYWMGFIQGRMFWLIPGLGIVLLARLAATARLSTHQSRLSR